MIPDNADPKSYLLKAFYDFISDNSGIPHIAIDTKSALDLNADLGPDNNTEVEILVLSISKTATVDLNFTLDNVSFSGTSNGHGYSYLIPLPAIVSLHDRDTQKGIQFEIIKEPELKQDPNVTPIKTKTKPKPKLSIVK